MRFLYVLISWVMYLVILFISFLVFTFLMLVSLLIFPDVCQSYLSGLSSHNKFGLRRRKRDSNFASSDQTKYLSAGGQTSICICDEERLCESRKEDERTLNAFRVSWAVFQLVFSLVSPQHCIRSEDETRRLRDEKRGEESEEQMEEEWQETNYKNKIKEVRRTQTWWCCWKTHTKYYFLVDLEYISTMNLLPLYLPCLSGGPTTHKIKTKWYYYSG